MIAKKKEDIAALREGGRRLAGVLGALAKAAVPGATTTNLNELAEKLIRKGGDEPAFLNYMPQGAQRAYPAALCISVNDEVVHGIPQEKPRTLKEGDIVALDLGLTHRGLIVDAAITVPVGKVDAAGKRLITATRRALAAGIAAATHGKVTGDVSFAIGAEIKKSGFVPARDLGGHGVGERVHEEPYIANWGKRGVGTVLVCGMVLALEPIVNEGTSNIRMTSDGYTIKTKDGKRSAHFEHTILITEGEAEILTATK